MKRALLVLALLLGVETARAATPVSAAEIAAELDAGRVGSAVVMCEDAEKRGPLDGELQPLCARALVALGDRLAQAGSPDNARKRWLQAVALDPRLLDDPTFAKKLEEAPEPGKKPDPRPIAKPDPGEPDPKREPRVIRPRPVVPREPVPAHVVKPAWSDSSTPKGPRAGRSLGLGLSVGFDGVIAADIGWLVNEQWLIEVALGIVYPTADARFRWLGLRQCVTPYLGIGLLVPFGTTDRFDLDVGGFRALYELGEAVHVDIGLAWTPMHSLDVHVGIAFMTPFDQDHPDTVVFFPQLSGGVSWYF